MIKLVKYNPSHLKNLSDYALDETQKPFTALPLEALDRIAQRNDSENAHPITILLDEKPIGFFVLDSGPDKSELTNNQHAFLLRSLSINPQYQGKGYGKIAMKLIDKFVIKNFSEINEIVLVVNQKNKAAYNLYLKVGYLDEGKTRISVKGLQHILTKNIGS